nr:ParB/RepB/Spo0J family partition protein [Streptomyces caniscabiei]
MGRGAAFGKAAGARSSRREAFDHALKGDHATAALAELPVTLISENPDNPRNHLRNLDETLETVRELGIILPIVVATADAYLRDRPDRADDLDPGAQYVVVDGHRRLECARRIGLATIPVRVDNARVATDEALLEAAFVANYHRDDMTDLEEAHALKALVDYYGSQTKAAKRLGIPQGTISSKLSLLKLSPELQKDLVTGARKVEHVRNLGKLAPSEQKAKADERAQAAPAKPAARDTAQAGPADYHAVIIPEASPAAREAPASAESQSRTVVEQQGPPAASERRETPSASASERLPEPRSEETGDDSRSEPADGQGRRQAKMPWDDGEACAEIAIAKLSATERRRMTARLVEYEAQQSGRRPASAEAG